MSKHKLDFTLILDLDDTIYQTRSLESKQFNPFFESIIQNLKPNHSPEKIEEVLNDLWKTPWDKVFLKHEIPLNIILEAIQVMEGLPLNFNIKPYPDYSFVKKLDCQKFLVTTGLTSLQKKKISALDLEGDFDEIIINDPFKKPGSKYAIFKNLINTYKLQTGTTYVIGDNPESELDAGAKLNLVTVQIIKEDVVKGNTANYYIHNFTELEHILKLP